MCCEEVGEGLETWRVVFERHGLEISGTKTEYTYETETTLKMVDAELPIVTSFKAKIYEISSDTHQLQFIKLHNF